MDKSKPAKSFQVTSPVDRLVYMVTNDANFALHISQQIIHFGYIVTHVRDIKSLPSNITGQHSVAIIIDSDSEDLAGGSPELFAGIHDLSNNHSQIIFTSNQDSQTVRLKSIRAGGAAFFTKPINILNLIDKLDSLNQSSLPPQPSKVLIIDDQNPVARYYQMVLKMSGMDAQIANTPVNVLEQMRDYHPDLLLMNTFLSGTHVADLARVIRQIDDFVSIPIIFLSNDDDFGKRIESLDLGGDDFLVKPIKASYLVAVVRSRLERSKTLRAYMVRDSLTNLLNHTAFRNVLGQEVSRCKRQSMKLALAMLDIDHFKMVNDTFGHAAGDSALIGLSRLLQQRLRKSDIVGRYGGDEFVALLVDCEAEQALKIMDEIRVHFAEIEFYPNAAKSLSLTFSCGISTFPKNQSVESLSDAADQALYIAKAGQRNRVIISSP